MAIIIAYVAISLTILEFGLAFSLWRRLQKERTENEEAIRAERDGYQEKLQIAFSEDEDERNKLLEQHERQLHLLNDSLNAALKAAVGWENQAKEWETKATSYRMFIEGVQQERDGWKGLYFETASGHDVAQMMMMRENDDIARAYTAATGKPPPRNKTVQEFREHFGAKHAEAIKEYRKDKGATSNAVTAANEAATLEAIEQTGPTV